MCISFFICLTLIDAVVSIDSKKKNAKFRFFGNTYPPYFSSSSFCRFSSFKSIESYLLHSSIASVLISVNLMFAVASVAVFNAVVVVVIVVDAAAVFAVFCVWWCCDCGRYVCSVLLLLILSLIVFRITDAVLLDVGWHLAIVDGNSVELLLQFAVFIMCR